LTAAEWNARYPIGIGVRYYPVQGHADNLIARTRSRAWTLASLTHVVLLEHQQQPGDYWQPMVGGRSLEHLETLDGSYTGPACRHK